MGTDDNRQSDGHSCRGLPLGWPNNVNTWYLQIQCDKLKVNRPRSITTWDKCFTSLICFFIQVGKKFFEIVLTNNTFMIFGYDFYVLLITCVSYTALAPFLLV